MWLLICIGFLVLSFLFFAVADLDNRNSKLLRELEDIKEFLKGDKDGLI